MLGQVIVLCIYIVYHRLMSHLSWSSHLGDLKTLTEDVLYETYRTEKLSKSILESRFVFNDERLAGNVITFCICSETEMLPEDLANHSVLAKEQELVKEQERVCYVAVCRVTFIDRISIQLREYELKAQRELSLMKQELLAKETALRLAFIYHFLGLLLNNGLTEISKLAPSRNLVLPIDWSNR